MEGKRCVKDTADPWNPGGINIFEHLGVTVVHGEDGTYCCEEPLCHAGMQAYGTSGEFRCESGVDGSEHDICGGKVCRSPCDCDPGQSCIDIDGEPRPPFGKVCDTSFSWDPAAPSAVCASNAVIEAVYGVSPADLIPCCGLGCFSGQKCVVGWVQGGGYLLERVVGVCGGPCGNGTWDPGETAISCPSDCAQPPRYPDCGEMSSAYSFHFAMCGDGVCDPNGYTAENCMSCPQDCGAAGDNSDSDYLPDCADNCPTMANGDQADADDDGLGDVCDPDDDQDGVEDVIDRCPATFDPEATVPSSGTLGKNRWALLTGNGVFSQGEPADGAHQSFTTVGTHGCSCEQIIERLGLGGGHSRFGCSTGVMLQWAQSAD